MKKMDVDFWKYTIGPIGLTAVGAIWAGIAAYKAQVKSDAAEIVANQQRLRAEALQLEVYNLGQKNFSKAQVIIDNLQTAASKSEAIINRTNDIILDQQKNLEVAYAAIHEFKRNDHLFNSLSGDLTLSFDLDDERFVQVDSEKTTRASDVEKYAQSLIEKLPITYSDISNKNYISYFIN